jgi:hypothetical protein
MPIDAVDVGESRGPGGLVEGTYSVSAKMPCNDGTTADKTAVVNVGAAAPLPTEVGTVRIGESFVAAPSGGGKKSFDAVVVWGPIAGYFVQQSKVPLVMNKVAEDTVQGIPFVYSMGMGVRRRDTKFRDSLQAVIDAKGGDMVKILQSFNVPMLPLPAGGQPAAKTN